MRRRAWLRGSAMAGFYCVSGKSVKDKLIEIIEN